jgi:hypothetical protein
MGTCNTADKADKMEIAFQVKGDGGTHVALPHDKATDDAINNNEKHVSVTLSFHIESSFKGYRLLGQNMPMDVDVELLKSRPFSLIKTWPSLACTVRKEHDVAADIKRPAPPDANTAAASGFSL